MHDRSIRATKGALILGLGLAAVLPATAQAQDRRVDHSTLSNPPVLEIYKPGEIKWLVGPFATFSGVQPVSDWTAGPGFGFDDLFRTSSMPVAHSVGGGIGFEGSGRPFYNNPSPVLSNLVVGFAADVVFRDARVTQDVDFPGGFLQKSFRSTVLFEQFVGLGQEIHLSDQTLVVPNVRVGLVEGQFKYTNFATFGGVVNDGSTSGYRVGWAAGAGIDVKQQGWPGLQFLWLHREFGSDSVDVPSTVGPLFNITGRQSWHEDELRVGLLFSIDHLMEFLGSPSAMPSHR